MALSTTFASIHPVRSRARTQASATSNGASRALTADLPRSRKYMFYTYILRSKKDDKLYTGATNDLRKRFSQHQNNQVAATKGRGPFELIYYEACLNQQDAFVREKYLKSGRGKLYLKKD